MSTMFKRDIERNMEVYVNDMLVKNIKAKQHLANLEETFGVLRR
jgi:hypothetical protein